MSTVNLHRVIEKLIEKNFYKLNTDDLNKMDKHDPTRKSQNSHSSKFQSNEIKMITKFSKWKDDIYCVYSKYLCKNQKNKILNITDQTIQVKDFIKILAISKIEDEIEDRFIEWFIKDYEKAEEKDKTKVEDKDTKDSLFFI